MAKDYGSRFGYATVIALIVVVLGASVAYVWSRHPLRIAEQISGLDIPWGTRLIHHEAEWGDFLPDGYSLRVYRLPQEFYDHVMANCETLGYKLGRLLAGDGSNSQVEPYFNNSIASCYRYTGGSGGYVMSLFAQAHLPAEGRLIVYIFHY